MKKSFTSLSKNKRKNTAVKNPAADLVTMLRCFLHHRQFCYLIIKVFVACYRSEHIHSIRLSRATFVFVWAYLYTVHSHCVSVMECFSLKL